MISSPHPDASSHAPGFITAPGETDVLLVVSALVVVRAILGIGILFLRLHTLPERIAHRSQKVQFQLVAILGLLALFTHNHAFWVAGLVLALIDLPDFGTPVRQIAGSWNELPAVSEAAPPGKPLPNPCRRADAGPRSERPTSSMEREAASRPGRPKVRADA